MWSLLHWDKRQTSREPRRVGGRKRFFIDNLLARIHFTIVIIRWTGLAPWEFEFFFSGSLTSTFLQGVVSVWGGGRIVLDVVQGYLAHKKQPRSPGTTIGP